MRNISLKQFGEKQLEHWGAAIDFGSTDKKNLTGLKLSLFFLVLF